MKHSLRDRLVLLLASLITLLLVGCVVLFWVDRASQSRSNALLAEARVTQFRKVIELRKERTSLWVDNYTYWDDLFDFVSNRDLKWAYHNLEVAVRRAGSHGLWVLDREADVQYRWSSGRQLGIDSVRDALLPLSDAEWKRDPIQVAFVADGSRVGVIHASRIHRTEDAGRTGEYSGYLICLTWLNRPWLSQFEVLTETSVEAVSGLDYKPLQAYYDDLGAYSVDMSLKDFAGRTVGFLRFSGSNLAVARSAEASAFSLILVTCFCFIILTTLASFVIRFVQRPLSKIYEAVTQEQPERLAGIVRGHDEVARLAQLSIEFFAQQQQLRAINETLEHRVEERTQELAEAYDGMILGWSRAMDSKDRETEGHTQRVAEMSARLGQAMELDADQIELLWRGSLLHDIGKIGIPDAILLKPGKLTPEEMEIMKTHTTLAYEMLKEVRFLEPCLCIPLSHHEKWDGTGYPQGLAGEEIPLLARIFAVADVWDALRSDRPYREGWSEYKVREYIREQSGKHFDPRVVETFLKLVPLAHPNDMTQHLKLVRGGQDSAESERRAA